MTPSDSLHTLIHSLSKSEKRAFKLFITKYKSQTANNYEVLFNKISEQKEYNEDQLKQALGQKSTLVKHLPSEKNYLFQLILASLRNIQKQSEVELKLRTELTNIRLLLSKDLIKPAGKIIKRTKKKLLTFEKWILLIQLIELEKEYFQKLGVHTIAEGDLVRLNKLLDMAISRVSNENDYWNLFVRLYKLHSQRVKWRRRLGPELKKFTNNSLLKSIKRAKSIQAKLNFHRIRALMHFMLNDFKSAFENNKQFLKLLDQNPHLIQEQPERYLSILNNYAMDCIGLEKYNEATQSVNKIKTMAESADFRSKKKLMKNAFRLSTILDLNILVRTENYTGLDSLRNNIHYGLKKYQSQLGVNNLFTIYYLLAYIEYESNNPDLCLEHLNEIIHHAETPILVDLQSFARILSIACHLKLESFNIIPYVAQQAMKFVLKKKHQFKVEHILINHYLSRNKLVNKSDISELINQTMLKLTALKTKRKEISAFEYFNMKSWVN